MMVRVLLNFVCSTVFVYSLPQNFDMGVTCVFLVYYSLLFLCWLSLTRLKWLIFSPLLCRFASSGRKLQLLLSDLVI